MSSIFTLSSRISNRVFARNLLLCNRLSINKVSTLATKENKGHFPRVHSSNCLHLTKNRPVVLSSSFHTSFVRYDEFKLIQVPQLAESLSEGDIRWEKGVGDAVKEDEVIAEVETDKTSIPIHSPAAGVIEELLVEDGSTVKPGMDIVKLKLGAAGAPSSAPPSPKKVEASPIPEPQAEAAPTPVSPKAPSAPAASKPGLPPPAVSKKTPPPAISIKPTQISGAGIRTEQRVKSNRMRQRIAQRLKEAQNNYAMLTTFNEVDMTNVMEMRKTHQEAFQKKHNMKLGFMSAFVKASAHALQDQPVVNAVLDGTDIVYRDYVDISVAVATPKGLVVPIIKNVENMNYSDIEKAIQKLGERARAGTLAIEDMDGGTFTISNGGVFGSLMGTPIINPPQSAILGMHAIFNRPVAINNEVKIRPMMYLALTYDHRLVDGREAVTFLRKIKDCVEDPRILLLDL